MSSLNLLTGWVGFIFFAIATGVFIIMTIKFGIKLKTFDGRARILAAIIDMVATGLCVVAILAGADAII